MKIAVCQLNFAVGNFDANIAKIKEAVLRETENGAELAVTTELGIWGYPAQDHLLHPYLLNKSTDLINELAFELKNACPLIVGNPVAKAATYEHSYYNAGLLLQDGRVTTVTTKKYLPYYDVFDEPRYFSPGQGPATFTLNGKKIIVSICEDMWQSKEFNVLINERIECEGFDDPDADLIINISASPFFSGKPKIRDIFLKQFASQFQKKLLYVNQVGAYDHIIFDGNSRFISERGEIVGVFNAFEQDVRIIDTLNTHSASVDANAINTDIIKNPFDVGDVHRALVFGIKEYGEKNGISEVCVGVSGGIDSAVVLALAVEAVGKENVVAVTMPSEFNAPETRADGKLLIKNLGVRSFDIPIDRLKSTFETELNTMPGKILNDTVRENIQSRIRGMLLMAIANQYRAAAVLSTGNKSELATGYCTMYGDTNGALAVIGDLWKTEVYALAEHINQLSATIPRTIIDRIPSAELRHNQHDTDSLPDYPLLDVLLDKLICRFKTSEELIREGYESSLIKKISALIQRSEFKRKQLPPVLKVSSRCLTSGRRMTVSGTPL